jgi:hypothetical protein
MSLITGSASITLLLNGANNQPVFSRPNQLFSVFGNELITALNQFIPPGGITVQMPNNGSGQTVQVTGTFLSDNLATYTYIPGTATLVAGQNISVVNATNSGVFNISNLVIQDVFTNTNLAGAPINQFTVAISNPDIPFAQEYVATATTSGVSLVYLRNAGSGVVNVTWTPSGGTSETVMPLPPGAEITMTFPPGNAGITALSFSSDTLQSDVVTNVALTSNVATLTTQTYHGFQVGQLVTTTGITNSGGAFNVTLQQITAVTNNTFSFVLVHANVVSQPATGAAPEAIVSVAAAAEASMMEWAILA